MFRSMRRIKNQMSKTDALALLRDCNEGVLGTISVDSGYPYTCVVNYVLYQGKVYFHSAKEGHKIDNIKNNSDISFTVYDRVKVIQETFTTKYQSVTCFGKAKIIECNKDILFEFIKKFSPNFLAKGRKYIKESIDAPLLVEIEIEYITGKERL